MHKLYKALPQAECVSIDLQAGISPWNYPMLMAVSTLALQLSCDAASRL